MKRSYYINILPGVFDGNDCCKSFGKNIHVYINPFQANTPFLYPLKTSENLWFSDVFRGYIRMEHWPEMG